MDSQTKASLSESADRWRHILEARRAQILLSEASLIKSALSEISANSSGDSSIAPTHPADLASDNQELDMLGRLSEKNIRSLHDLEDAIDRLDRGSFGHCLKCGQFISLARLKVLPETKFCLQCAGELEL